jgi:hypothetical protein
MEQAARQPSTDDIWRHKRHGNEYAIVAVANLNATRPDFMATVVYRDLDGNVWSRPLHEWHDSFEFVGTAARGKKLEARKVHAVMPVEALMRTSIENVQDVLDAIARLGG